MNQSRKDIKRWVIPDKMVIAQAGKKDLLMVIKPLVEKQDKHLTLVVRQNGYVEFHLTKEKPSILHETIAKGQIDFDKLKSEAMKLYKRTTKPIRKDDKRYKDFLVLIPRDLERLEDFRGLFVRKDTFVHPSKEEEQIIREELEKYFDVIYFDEITDEKLRFALALSSRDRLYYLFMDRNSRYLFPVSQAAKILPSAIEWKEKICTECHKMINANRLDCPFCEAKQDEFITDFFP